MSAEELACRLHSALSGYTKETGLTLQDTENLSIRIHPYDWYNAKRSFDLHYFSGGIGDAIMGVPIVTDQAIERDHPVLVSHWETEL